MENKEKWCFIVNPTAGGGAGKLVIPELEKQIANRSLEATILLTERHDHAIGLSKRSLENGCSHIIAVGGDGTMNEVARPLIGQKHVTTGLIPAGTGNDFIQILGFPDRFSEVHWKIFFRQSTIHMDAGQVNGLYFLNGMGLGFDAQVAAENYVEPGEVPKGTHITDKKVDYYQTEKITVDFGKKVPFHVDGELYFDTTFEVSLLPLALNIIYNPEGKHFFNE